MREDLLQIRSFGVNFYVLRDSQGLYLIDCGFIGGRQHLQQALKERGWENEKIIAIVLTHGHLDHILNVGIVAEESGAWIAAPRLDSEYYAGKSICSGLSRITGLLEGAGRPLLGFSKFTPTRLLDHGDQLDIWHGLEVIHLPGHTAGHCGFYCEKLNLLFCADLFASYEHFSHLPPSIFNSDGSQISSSIEVALGLDLVGVLPNHCDKASPEVHLSRLETLHNASQK